MSQLPDSPDDFREPAEVRSPMEIMREFGILSVEDERPCVKCIECDAPCDPGFRLCDRHYVESKS